MKSTIKYTLLAATVVLVSAPLLTACHTIQGTAQGAERDIRSVEHAVDSDRHHHATKTKKHKAHVHHKAMAKNKNETHKSTHATDEHSSRMNNDQSAPPAQTSTENKTTNTNTTSNY